MPTKREKFAEFESFQNCITLFWENLNKGFPLKGKWHKEHFKNQKPIVLELGCGKGEYTIGLAQKHPEKNFIGVDIKGNRIWTGAKQATESKMENVAFIRTKIDFIDYCFEENEVDDIWITFPDPQPQSPRAKQRLTHKLFLDRYKKFLKKGGLVHLKTDSTSLYEFTLEVIAENKLSILWHTNDLYKNCPSDRQELVNIKTHYETLFTAKGEDIKYICFRLN